MQASSPTTVSVVLTAEDWVIEPRKFSERGSRIEGQVAGKLLPRLRAESTQALKPVEVQVKAAKSPRRRNGIRLALQGSIRMICQRCLKSMDVALSAKAAVEWVSTEAELEAADADDEWDAMLEQEKFDLLPLMEDELLLAVPFAPLHVDCKAAGATEAGEKVSPFAALAALKQR